jgi:hypothetical protein
MPTMYTHGTALQVEDPGQLIRFGKLGWGAEAEFLPPQPDPRFPDTFDKFGPGSWFHLPLTSEPVADGIGRTVLTSILLMFETSSCQITALHIYDGPTRIEVADYPTDEQHFPGGLRSANLFQPFTYELRQPHTMLSAAGVSFYACSTTLPSRFETVPPRVLTVAAVGGVYRQDSIFTIFFTNVAQLFTGGPRLGG